MRLLILVLCILFCIPAPADASEILENRVFEDGIFTVQLHPAGQPFGTPLLQLRSDETLELHFDELGDMVSDLRYAIVQCDHEWRPTGNSTFDYIEGFSEGYIEDYDYSFNTLQPYVHYRLEIPNNDLTITQSGNYAIVIYRDNLEDPLLTRRFMMADPRIDIRGGVAYTRNPDLRNKFQEVVFSLLHEGFAITNPFQEINVTVTQNDRWDNALYALKPLHIHEHELLFNHHMKIVFPSSREFREMDIRTLRYRTEGVGAIHVSDTANQVYLLPDPMRRLESFSPVGDLNGKFTIDRQEGRHGDLESDYTWVRFYLPFRNKLGNGTFYVVGAFNDYDLKADNRMSYNHETKSYEANIYMKQGFYNYSYVFVEDGQTFKDHSFTEGNHYDTENDYAVYVYYRPFGQRYDELIGFTFLNSRLTRY